MNHQSAGALTCNAGTCPDWESNLQPFGVQYNAPTNCAPWPRPSGPTFLRAACYKRYKDSLGTLILSDVPLRED